MALLTFSLEGGGAERVMATLANGFHRAGYPVDLVCVQATGPYLHELDAGVHVVNLDASRSMLATIPLIRYLRRVRPTALLSTLAGVSIAAATACRLARVRTRFVARETTHATADNRTNWTGDYGALALMRRWAYHSADRVVAPSRGVADDLVTNVGVTAAQVAIVSNPVDIDRIDRLALEPAPYLAGLAPSTKIVVSVGRLSVEKDPSTLLRAFATLRRRDVMLLLLGEGEERRDLERLTAELRLDGSVLMPGFVANPFCYLKRASVYVLSSRYEGMPNTLLQALATGTPVVSTDCLSGPREILENGRWGRLVPVGDVGAMARAIDEALDGQVSSPPRDLVIERYGLDGVVERYRRVLFD